MDTTRVRAKFRVNSIRRSMGNRLDPETQKYVPSEVWSIEMSPVAGGTGTSQENRQFWAATPGGKIELLTVNPQAVTAFDLEREFYVDFSPADR